MKPLLKFYRKSNDGFALVVTMLLLMLVTIIALGLLSLSSTALRSSGGALARSQAQANARMALALAIGQLQSATGPDQRITAPADILVGGGEGEEPASAHRGWCGAWESYGARDGDGAESAGDFEKGRKDRFIDWLVTSTGVKKEDRFQQVKGTPSESVVIRRIEQAPDAEVRIPLITTQDNGRLGWWTEDESTKARANLPVQEPGSLSMGDKLVARHAAPSPRPEGLKEITGFSPNEDEACKLLTPGQLRQAAESWPEAMTKDFTTYSKSLLVNVRDGGMKKDLSTLFELDYENIDRAKYGKWFGKGTLSELPPYIYGVDEAHKASLGVQRVALGARWNVLYFYYRLYKESKSLSGGGIPEIAHQSSLINWREKDTKYKKEVPDEFGILGDPMGGFRCPRISQIAFVLQTHVQKKTVNGESQLVPYLGYRYHVSLWNPFDTKLSFPEEFSFAAKVYTRMPILLRATSTAGKSLPEKVASEYIKEEATGEGRYFRNAGGAPLTLEPGENAVFTYRKDKGYFEKGYYLTSEYITKETELTGLQIPEGQNGEGLNESIEFYLKGRNPSSGSGGTDFAQFMDLWMGREGVSAGYERRGDIVSIRSMDYGKLLLEKKFSRTYDELYNAYTNSKREEMAALVMTLRGTEFSTYTGGEGSPFYLNSGLTRVSSLLEGKEIELMSEKFEYKLDTVVGTDNPTTMLGVADDLVHAYIGLSNSGGPTHVIATSLPKVPLTSLAQFRHAGTGDGAAVVSSLMGRERASSGYSSGGEFTPAPHADQAIGNSYASPLVAKDAYKTTVTTYSYLDHRYLGNQALWDQYFLSSLAPRDTKFGDPKSMPDGWKEFLSGEGKLLNSRFSPWLGGETLSEVQDLVFDGDTLNADAYEKIAANLIYEGGFNINSTSVPAWRALLSSTRGQALLASGGQAGGHEDKSCFSRSDFVGSVSVDESSGDTETHFSGFRELNDAQITSLAEHIVQQVRLRGPFLNLAQFINRSLSTNDEAALSGPLQKAIDDAGLNEALKSSGRTPKPVPNLPYPAAAEHDGTTAAGVPGWLMQGDILDPIGPSLVPRGDTFRVRAYGEARSPSGAILARAWCEAVVQRIPTFIDSSEEDAEFPPTETVNQTFGRRYEIVQFRWLTGPEAL